MAWKQIIPANSGGGRKRSDPAGTLYASGQFTLTHTAVKLLGNPDRAKVFVDVETGRFRLEPSTPSDSGAFALAGGDNTPARFSCRALIKEHPELAGAYSVQKIKGGIELRKKEEE